MPEVVELREVTDRRDVIHRAVQRLSAGELVALPSEAGYVVAGFALAERVGSRIAAANSTVALLLRAADETADFLPHLSPVGFRLARRCWPGPLVLRASANLANGFWQALPDGTRTAVAVNGELSLRVSSHPVLSEVGKLLRGPLLVREIDGWPADGKFEHAAWRDIVLVVNEGSTAVPATSVVRVDEHGWTAERLGALNEQRLQLAACELLLFVCTGNTCRSPMAEALCRHLLAERLKCSPQELTKHGFAVASAGLAADFGCSASPESVEMMRRRGIDLKAHASHPLTDRLIEHADRCYTMTNHHRNAILETHPETAGRMQVLARDGTDIFDPIGLGWDHYAACAASIEQHLAKILDELL